ncbi:MAG: hypothetical protein Q8Q02_12580 [Nocardioides sp.]|nr:hypothetical protein [Nocardioides sp.]
MSSPTRYDGPAVTAERHAARALAHLTTYSLDPARRATECDRCETVLADRADLWNFGGRAEVCAACRDRFIAGPDGALGLVYLSTCERLPADAGEHGPEPTYILDLRHLAPEWET